MKVKIILILFFSVLLLAPQLIQAQNLQDAFKADGSLGTVATGGGFKAATPEFIVGSIIKVALSLIGVIFLTLMVYGGYLWMIDRGNNQQVEKAKALITAAIIGLIIVFGAYAITYFVVSSVETHTLTTP